MTIKQATDADAFAGQRLRVARNREGLTQKELANQVGVPFQDIQKYETGVNRIGAGRIVLFADILNVPITWFFEEKQPVLDLHPQKAATFGGLDLDIAKAASSLPDELKRSYLELIKTTSNRLAESRRREFHSIDAVESNEDTSD